MVKNLARNIVAILVTLLTSTAALFVGTSTAHAEVVGVFSPAMGRNIDVEILRGSGGGPMPTLYLLDGLRGVTENGWLVNTDVVPFFAGKHVNVVIPLGGGGTFYTDWENDDPHFGRVKWETFLTRELPAFMAANYGSDFYHNAIAGLSMSGTSALTLAAHNPGFYRAVASMSGYPTASMPGYAQGIMASVYEMGGNPLNMWGFWPNLKWTGNDPLMQVGNYRGMGVYLSAGYGGAGPFGEVNPFAGNFNALSFIQQVPLETAAGLSTTAFLPAVFLAGARVQSDIQGTGTHRWEFWGPKLHDAWFGTIAPSIGA